MGSISERQERLVGLMRRQGHASVASLAASLGVSRRTVIRDIGALRERGFLIDTEPGRGGGVRIDVNSIQVAPRLNAAEAVALILAVAALDATHPLPLAGRARAALARIEVSLPPQRVRELQALMRRILVGEALPKAAAMEAGQASKGVLEGFEAAFADQVAVRFSYTDRTGARSTRQVEPQALLLRMPLWYIVGFDLGRDGWRLFRMDRISRLKPLDRRQFRLRPLRAAKGVCPDGQPGAIRLATSGRQNREASGW